MIFKKIYEVVNFPVTICLNTKNPWNGKVKVSNSIVDYNKKIITSLVELTKYIPIEKYLIIESIETIEECIISPIKPDKVLDKEIESVVLLERKEDDDLVSESYIKISRKKSSKKEGLND